MLPEKRERMVDATAMISVEVFSLSLRVRPKAYMSQAMEETLHPLWIPPRDWRRDVMAVLTRSGTHDRPKTFIAK